MMKWQPLRFEAVLPLLLIHAFYINRTLGCSDLARSYASGSHDGSILTTEELQLNNAGENGTLVVHTPEELRAGLEQSNVTCIVIANNLDLKWYNGWEKGSLVSSRPIFRKTDVTLIGASNGGKLMEIDIGRMQFLGSTILLSGITLTIDRLYLRNVPSINSMVLAENLGRSRIKMSNSVINMKLTSSGLTDFTLKSPLVSAMLDVNKLDPESCTMEEQEIECPNGGYYFGNFSKPVGRMGKMLLGASLEFRNVLIAIQHDDTSTVSTSSELGEYLRQGLRYNLHVSPLGRVVGMADATACSSPDSHITLRQDVGIHGRLGAFGTTFLVFNNKEDCLTVGEGITLHVEDFVLDGAVFQDRFQPTLVPFFELDGNATLWFEAVVVMVEANSGESSLSDLENELRSTLSDGKKVSITRKTIGEFYHEATMIKNSFKNPELTGLLVEDGIIAYANDTQVRLTHTLFVLDTSMYPELEDHKVPHQKHRILKIIGPVIGALLGILAAIAVKYKLKARKKVIPPSEDMSLSLSSPLLKDRKTDEELMVMSTSSDGLNQQMHHEHQVVAEKLLESLTLGNLIGRGGFGQVYKATWNGAMVAVKVIFHRESIISADEDAAREASLSANLRHPNVVQTFMQATRTVTETSDKASSVSTSTEDSPYVGIHDVLNSADETKAEQSGDPSSNLMPCVQHKETWLVQEYCDLGSLGHSIQLKLLDRGDKVDLEAVIRTCADIARGMEYLHSRNVIHGDLKCTNVLLCSSVQDPRGFIAKVADFGLSRKMAVNVTHISTNTVGTLTHMPPELLRGRKLVPKGDVYSFGIMLWEILMGKSPFEGWTVPQLIRSVVNQKWRPEFPSFAPHGLTELGGRCLKEDPQDRPSFCEILRVLEDLQKLTREQ